MGGLWLRPFIFYFFLIFSSSELAGRESTGQKKWKEDLATAILLGLGGDWGEGRGGGGGGVGEAAAFGEIYQFVIYLRRFFFLLCFVFCVLF